MPICERRIVNESAETGGYTLLLFAADKTMDEFAQATSQRPDLPPEFGKVHTFQHEVAPGGEANQSVAFTEVGSYGAFCYYGPSNPGIAGAMLEVE